MKNGFTMVELMAVIIILACISLVSFPVINGLIKDTEVNADKDLVKTIIDEATILYNDYVFQDRQNELINKNIYDLLSTKNKPEKGSLVINDLGNVFVTVKIEDRCYKKDYDEIVINSIECES